MENLKKLIIFLFSSLIIYISTLIIVNALNISVENGFGYAPAPENVPTDLEGVLLNITNYLLGFIAIIATLVIIYGGIMYLTSLGNDDRRAQAQKTIASGVIGIMIAGLAYAIVTAVINILRNQS